MKIENSLERRGNRSVQFSAIEFFYFSTNNNCIFFPHIGGTPSIDLCLDLQKALTVDLKVYLK